MSFKNVLQLLFAPNLLLKESLEDEIKKWIKKREELGSVVSASSQGAKILELHSMLSNVIEAKRKALALALLWILTPLILGFAAAQAIKCFTVVSSDIKDIIRLSSLVILAFATFSRLGEMATFEGGTMPEKSNILLFKLLYALGFLLGTIALLLN
jgi:hypothetical protein